MMLTDKEKYSIGLWDRIDFIHSAWSDEPDEFKIFCSTLLSNQANFISRLNEREVNDLLALLKVSKVSQLLKSVVSFAKANFNKYKNIITIATPTAAMEIKYGYINKSINEVTETKQRTIIASRRSFFTNSEFEIDIPDTYKDKNTLSVLAILVPFGMSMVAGLQSNAIIPICGIEQIYTNIDMTNNKYFIKIPLQTCSSISKKDLQDLKTSILEEKS